MKLQFVTTLTLVGFAILTSAHPGVYEEHNAADELQKREFKDNAHRSFEKCADKFERSGLKARAEARRKATVEKLRKRLPTRDTDSVLATDHNKTSSGYTEGTSETVLFTSNSTCVLNPEGETGPYYVKGEYIRSDLRDSQTGVDIVIDGQFLDVETCEPITNLWWDIWNCNATGIYSGLIATGNGNTDDTSNLNKTFLRGIQETDSDGVIQFQTVFPGHYSGRTTHHHMVAHLNATVLTNNTLTGGTVAHVGQAFWDQDLIYAVEATYPYNTNDITITTNADDRVFATETASTTSDPVFDFVYLGDSVEDGIFGWITIAVNTSASYDPKYSFTLTSSGGEAESGGSGM